MPSKDKHSKAERAKSSPLDLVATKEGWVYRESGVVDGVSNRRYCKLYGHTTGSASFVTFRKQSSHHPSKQWPLCWQCQVSAVANKEFMVRDRHTSTIWALATGRYDHKHLWSFTVSWPGAADGEYAPVTLALEDRESADSWHAAFSAVLAGLKQCAPEAAAASTAAATGCSPRAEMTAGSAGQPRQSPAAPEPDRERHVTIVPPLLLEEARETQDYATPLATSRRPPEEAATPATPWRLGGRKWASFRHVNGVAVYQEGEGLQDEGGAFMVSAVVRSDPRACFKALLELDPQYQDMPFALEAEVVEASSPGARIITAMLAPEGWPAALCPPRRVTLQQTWREEDDGTFILLLQSTRHPAVPDAATPWWAWRAPVCTDQVAAGFTIAPLQSKYVREGASLECLVTLVIKVDLGGWLGSRARWAASLRPLHRALREAYLQPLLMSVITLRDKVEQERFVVKPFTMGQQSDPEQYQRRASLAGGPSRHPSKLAPAGSMFAPLSQGSISQTTIDITAVAGSAQAAGTGRTAACGTADGGQVPAGWQWDVSGTLDPKFWSCPGGAGFKVRGPGYLRDKKKVLADEPVFGLAAVDLLEVTQPTLHIARHLPSLRNSAAPFTFLVQLMVPGPPHLSLTMSWAADYNPDGGDGPSSASMTSSPTVGGSPVVITGSPSHFADTPDSRSARETHDSADGDSDAELVRSAFDVCLARFLAGDSAEAVARRHQTFKLIPSVVKGSWVIKQSVGNTPVLLGKKLTTKYFRGPNYFEVDVDVGSSVAAASVVGLVSPVTKSLVLDMGILIEGRKDDELPERLLGTVRFAELDLKQAALLDAATGRLTPAAQRTGPHTAKAAAATKAAPASKKVA